MNIFTKRLIGLAVSLAAITYFGITHFSAADTYVKDRLKDQPDSEPKTGTQSKKQES